MFSAFYKTKHEWRRVAVYQPVLIAGTGLSNEDGSQRQDILRTCHPGMRVALRRVPTSRHPNAVACFVNEGRQIGNLSTEDADWVAPVLDSEKATFDAEIWSVEKMVGGNGRELLASRLMLTLHELVPVKRFSWTAWLRGNRRKKPEVTLR